MSYSVLISTRAVKDIAALPEQMKERVKEAIASLEKNPRPHGVKKLKGKEGYRIRVGDYRILYGIEDAVKIVAVERVRHRKESYK